MCIQIYSYSCEMSVRSFGSCKWTWWFCFFCFFFTLLLLLPLCFGLIFSVFAPMQPLLKTWRCFNKQSLSLNEPFLILREKSPSGDFCGYARPKHFVLRYLIYLELNRGATAVENAYWFLFLCIYASFILSVEDVFPPLVRKGQQVNAQVVQLEPAAFLS